MAKCIVTKGRIRVGGQVKLPGDEIELFGKDLERKVERGTVEIIDTAPEYGEAVNKGVHAKALSEKNAIIQKLEEELALYRDAPGDFGEAKKELAITRGQLTKARNRISELEKELKESEENS